MLHAGLVTQATRSEILIVSEGGRPNFTLVGCDVHCEPLDAMRGRCFPLMPQAKWPSAVLDGLEIRASARLQKARERGTNLGVE